MRITIPKVHGQTQREKVIRTIALVLVFAAVIWAFMKNNERVVDVLNRESSVYDETNTLDKAQRKFVASFIKTLRDEYGISCRVQIFGGDFVVPDLDAKTMYIGLAPSIKAVELRFPAMMRQALGQEFIDSLKTEYFLPSFEFGDWPMTIQEVLVLIFERLDQIQQGETNSE